MPEPRHFRKESYDERERSRSFPCVRGLTLQYYAHLDSWEPGLKTGKHVKQGDVLGTVGNTGNAKSTPSHLHFGISRLRPVRLSRVRFDPMDVLDTAKTQPRAGKLAGGV